MVNLKKTDTAGHKVARRVKTQKSQKQSHNEGASFTVGAVEIENVVELFKKLNL